MMNSSESSPTSTKYWPRTSSMVSLLNPSSCQTLYCCMGIQENFRCIRGQQWTILNEQYTLLPLTLGRGQTANIQFHQVVSWALYPTIIVTKKPCSVPLFALHETCSVETATCASDGRIVPFNVQVLVLAVAILCPQNHTKIKT